MPLGAAVLLLACPPGRDSESADDDATDDDDAAGPGCSLAVTDVSGALPELARRGDCSVVGLETTFYGFFIADREPPPQGGTAEAWWASVEASGTTFLSGFFGNPQPLEAGSTGIVGAGGASFYIAAEDWGVYTFLPDSPWTLQAVDVKARTFTLVIDGEVDGGDSDWLAGGAGEDGFLDVPEVDGAGTVTVQGAWVFRE